MSAIWIAALALLSPPDSPIEAPDPPPIVGKELKSVVKDALKQSYVRDEKGEASYALPIKGLCDAHDLLSADSSLSATEREELRIQVRSRLIALGDKVAERHYKDLAKREREEAKAKRRKAAADDTAKNDPAKGGAASHDDAKGATGASAPAGARGGNAEEDNGEALVELIRTTVAPETWDVAGGPGTIVYYRQWKALVVRQTAQVHWLIGGLRKQLEKQ
ncbi:MAG: hypothetical protein HYS13_10185 [Planctomycetia bacterium]|nr:hypothetical protein [Planctomycetia bacterium]